MQCRRRRRLGLDNHISIFLESAPEVATRFGYPNVPDGCTLIPFETKIEFIEANLYFVYSGGKVNSVAVARSEFPPGRSPPTV